VYWEISKENGRNKNKKQFVMKDVMIV